MSKNIIILLIIILLGLSGYFLWNVYSVVQKEKESTSQIIEVKTPPIQKEQKEEQQNQKPQKREDTKPQQQTSAYHVTSKDCKNNCTAFPKSSQGWEYCANICGIIPLGTTETPSDDCAQKHGLARDYCLRDHAITQGNLDGCGAITDRGIKEQCQERIAENLIDESF